MIKKSAGLDQLGPPGGVYKHGGGDQYKHVKVNNAHSIAHRVNSSIGLRKKKLKISLAKLKLPE